MRTQRSARSHGRLLVAVVLTVGVAGVGPAWATGMDPLGDVTETVDQVSGPVDDVVDQVTEPVGDVVDPVTEPVGDVVDPVTEPVDDVVDQVTGPVDDVVDQVTGPVEGTVDQVTGAVDDTAAAAAGAGQETTQGAGALGGRGAEEGSEDRGDKERPGTSPERGGVSKRSVGTVEASSPGLGREAWYQGMPDAGASQVRAASGPCPNGIDAACLLDALYGAGAGAAEALGTLFRRLATTGLGLFALAMIALLAAGSGGAILTWSGRRERRRAPQPPFQVPL